MRLNGFHFLPFTLVLALCLPVRAYSDDSDQDVTRVGIGQHRIPVNVYPALRPNLLRLDLYASKDGGKTWYLADRLPPDGKAFSFDAPENGTYWLAVQRINRDGSAEPRDALLRADLKLQVGTNALAQPKDANGAVQNLKTEVNALRQQLERVEKRLSELEKALVK